MNRWLFSGVFAAAGATALAAVAHVALVKAPSQTASAAPSSCPFAGGVHQVDRDQARRDRVASLAGEGRAEHKHVLGVTLGKSNRGALDVWAAARGMQCMGRKGSHDIECKAERPAAVAQQYASAEELTVFASFDGSKTLTQLRLVANFSDAGKAAEALRHTLRESRAQAGEPSHVSGEPEAHYLMGGLWQQARVEFRRADLYTTVSATNLGNTFALSHHIEALETDPT